LTTLLNVKQKQVSISVLGSIQWLVLLRMKVYNTTCEKEQPENKKEGREERRNCI
jgi:hypothetical protein